MLKLRHRPLGQALLVGLGLTFATAAGCEKGSTTDPEAGSNLLGPTASSNDDDLGSLDDEDEGLFDDEEEGDGELGGLEDGEGGEKVADNGKKLPPKAKPVQKCWTEKVAVEGKKTKKGKQKYTKKKVCGLKDPKPKVSASHGIGALMGDFRWGMSPKQVFKVLSQDIESEYAKRQTKAKDATSQDRNGRWRREQLQAVKQNHTKFTTGSKHRWGVSLIQYEYADDNEEEMLWASTGKGLRKFYFFKDNELWKILYAYSTDVWRGKSYSDVVEEKFKKWFGVTPKEKTKKDPKTEQPVLVYNEWEAMEGEKIRSFDMTSVHGVIVLAVVDGPAEDRIGERLPNLPKDDKMVDAVSDVLGGSDVCYTPDGDITECGSGSSVNID